MLYLGQLSANVKQYFSKLILFIASEHQIHLWHDVNLQLGLSLKGPQVDVCRIHFHIYFRGCFPLTVAILTKLVQQITQLELSLRWTCQTRFQ